MRGRRPTRLPISPGQAFVLQSSCVDRSGNGACEQGDTVDNALYSHITHVFGELGGSMSIYTGG